MRIYQSALGFWWTRRVQNAGDGSTWKWLIQVQERTRILCLGFVSSLHSGKDSGHTWVDDQSTDECLLVASRNSRCSDSMPELERVMPTIRGILDSRGMSVNSPEVCFRSGEPYGVTENSGLR
jgi:hypothetical protein